MSAVMRGLVSFTLRRRDAERGSFSAMVVILIVMLFAVAGLIYDGGSAINARQQAFDDAEQAARAGANQIDMDLFRSEGIVEILPGAADTAAREFLNGLPGRQYSTVTVDAQVDQVDVTVARSVPTQLLKLVFVDDFTIEGSATSQPEVGILGGAP